MEVGRGTEGVWEGTEVREVCWKENKEVDYM